MEANILIIILLVVSMTTLQSGKLKQNQIVQFAQERDEQAQLAVELQQQIEQISQLKDEEAQQAAEMYKEIESLRHELREANQTASLSVKLQTMREMDLKELQDRYQESKVKQEEQYHLLNQLSERLRAVSSYFHQVADNDGVSGLSGRDSVLLEK